MTPPTEISWPQRLANFEGALNQLEKEGVIQRFELVRLLLQDLDQRLLLKI